MRRLLPGSTAGQVAVIVVVATLIAHVISSVIWIRMREAVPPQFRVATERMAIFTHACAAIPAEMCAAAAAAADRPTLRIRLVEQPPDGQALQPRMAAVLHRQLAPLAAQGRITKAGVSVGVPVHGQWLRFDLDAARLRPRWLHPVLTISFLLFLTAVPLLALSLWAVRQVTRPLEQLATAAEVIGETDPRPALREAGTREIRALARAFNDLLDRLRRHVAERTRMLAAVSHDLRTPLTRIRLRAEQIEDENLRGRLLRDVRMMELMIGSALSLLEAQEKREPAETVDLAALLQTICDEFADAGFDVTFSGPLHCPARVQPRALERALNNVIDNAQKFGGAARVGLRVTPGGLEIDVEDDGPGIPPEERENVLKPFYRAAAGAEVPGSGLGLAIARTLVAAQGGTLTLHERAPHGLCVRLILPRET